MSSVGNMFARRAAASEGSHAREDAKASLLRFNEKRDQEISDQIEKIRELKKQIGRTRNASIKAAIEVQLAQEQDALDTIRARNAKVQAAGPTATVDVLAEISAHSLPIGRPEAHHANPVTYEYGPNSELPEKTKHEADNVTHRIDSLGPRVPTPPRPPSGP